MNEELKIAPTMQEEFSQIAEENQIKIKAEMPEILESFYEFIVQFGRIDKEAIYQSYQGKSMASARGRNKNHYAIISLLEIKERGENIQRIEYNTSDDGENFDEEINYALQEAIVEIEIASNLLFETQRSVQILSQMFTHPRGMELFAKKSISPLYAIQKNEENGQDTKKQAYKAKLLCHCSYYSKIAIRIDTFSSVKVDIKNTDVLYA